MFFAAVLAWNLIGAGLFGFMINPPLALYCTPALNMTATTPAPRSLASTACWACGFLVQALWPSRVTSRPACVRSRE